MPWYQHFGFYQIFHPKGDFDFQQEPAVRKNRLWKVWPTKNSALSYVNVRFPGLTLLRMEQKLWWALLDSTESLFKHFPMAFEGDFKPKVLNWTCACVSSLLSPKKTKQKSANSISVLSMSVQKAKNCSFLVPVLVPCWWYEILKEEEFLLALLPG